MFERARRFSFSDLLSWCLVLFGVAGCSANQPSTTPRPLIVPAPAIERPAAEPANGVMLGIDVLEADGFGILQGKRVGLLTHPAGVNRHGVPTVDILRRAPRVKLVALYGPEHGVHGDAPAAVGVANSVDERTGLPVFSLYPPRRPSKDMLKGVDAMVIDLQDIGTRSYTFIAAMKWAMEGCFQNDVEVIVLDRPNPLGGLKVDGPPLDAALARANYVGAFRVPYVHGLTIGELARLAKEAPGVLAVTDAVRERGRLTVVPMRGWSRAMRWPETGLKWVPTSAGIQDWAAVQGYPMVGLGTYFDPKAKFDIGFRSGVGKDHIFRGISSTRVGIDALEKELQAIEVPGIRFQRMKALDRQGKPTNGIYIDIVDYAAWRPAELNFHLMKLACKLHPQNPFAPAPGRDFTGFLRHMGSAEFLQEIATFGAFVDVEKWIQTWRERAAVYQEASKKYWLYR